MFYVNTFFRLNKIRWLVYVFYLNNLSFPSPGADRNSSCGNLNPKNIEDKNVNMGTGLFLPETEQD